MGINRPERVAPWHGGDPTKGRARRFARLELLLSTVLIEMTQLSDFRALVAAGTEKWARVIRTANIKAE
jgi:hypothetical protein